MSPEVADALVRLVANGRKFGVADAVVIEHLIEMGVPKEHAAELLTEIATGLQQGKDAAASGVGSADGPPGSALFTTAFKEGQRTAAAHEQQRRSHRGMLVVVVIVVIGVLVYWFTRGP